MEALAHALSRIWQIHSALKYGECAQLAELPAPILFCFRLLEPRSHSHASKISMTRRASFISAGKVKIAANLLRGVESGGKTERRRTTRARSMNQGESRKSVTKDMYLLLLLESNGESTLWSYIKILVKIDFHPE